jgi:MHS family proline/betaine transporter-like MFS transporter
MSANPTPSPAMVRKVVIASILGNAFEWFDFAIYGLFAVTIARLYFPADNAFASLMLTLATFGIGFAVRPLGGVLLGLYGDRVGRKKALSVTIVLMAVGTGMIGLLPTYAAIGVAAPILMVIARMIQGMSAGGEFSGATTMLVEFAPAHRRGFFGSFQMCSQALAFSLGAAVAYLLTTHLNAAQLETWGWRLPFLFGILIGPVGWLIRSKVDESPEFLAYRRSANTSEKATPTPLRDILRKYPRELLSSTGICVVGTVSAYVFVFFLPIFAKQRMRIAPRSSARLSFWCSVRWPVISRIAMDARRYCCPACSATASLPGSSFITSSRRRRFSRYWCCKWACRSS